MTLKDRIDWHWGAVLVLCVVRLALGQVAPPSQGTGCSGKPLPDAEIAREGEKPEELLQAADLYQEALRCFPNDDANRAGVLLKLGRVQLRLGKPVPALAALSEAVEIFGHASPELGARRSEEEAAHFYQGTAFSSLGRNEEAISAYKEALRLAEKAHDNRAEILALADLGRVYYLMGENQSALGFYSRALRNERDEKQKTFLLDLTGRAYARMNESGLAMHYYLGALALARKTKYYRFIAYTSNDIGSLLLEDRRPREAMRYHAAALRVLEGHEPSNLDGIAETLTLLADAQRASQLFKPATENYERALALQQKTADVLGEAETRFSLAASALALHHPEAALTLLTRAAELRQQAHDREGEASARFEMAKIYAAQSNLSAAKTQIETAIQLAEEIRQATPGPHLRTTSFASAQTMYRREIDWVLQRPPIADSDQQLAFDLLQKAQSRTLLEALESRTSAAAISDSDLLLRRSQLVSQLNKANQRLDWLVRRSAAPELTEQAFLDVRQSETSLDQFDAEARGLEPRLAMTSSRIVSTPVIRRVLDQESGFVQFYLSSPHSYAWVITKADFRLVTLPDKNWLEPEIRRVIQVGGTGDWTSVQRLARRALRQRLAGLFASAAIKRWIIVPDGSLYYFPFVLLFDDGTEHEIIKVPSASVLSILRETTPNARPALKIAVFADPVYDAQDSRVSLAHAPDRPRLLSRTNGAKERFYPRLRYSREEAKLISRLVPPDQSKSNLDFAAQPENATGSTLKNFDVIHFAAHSVVDDRHPELSRIVLTLVTKTGQPRDGYLFLKDIYRMELTANLVVLSSCEGALGRRDVGEGPMSLSRAFLFAGSKSVLATLWKTDDEVTARFMGAFYRHMLIDHLSPLQALTRTQVEFRHHAIRQFRNPFYWAGFELYGDWLIE